MPKFKKGDKVKVRFDTMSPYWGQIGVIDKEPEKESSGFSYTVKLDWNGFPVVSHFMEQELEAVE